MAIGRKASRAVDALERRDVRALKVQAESFVREHPLATVAGAVGVGALLGGVLMKGAGRLVFIAAASAAVAEIWKSEGGIDVRGLIDKLSGEDDHRPHEEPLRKRPGVA